MLDIACRHFRAFDARERAPGERALAALQGWIGHLLGSGGETMQRGCLIVTDRRVVYYRTSIFGQVLDAIPLENVVSIEMRPMGGYRTLTVRGSHTEISFNTYEPRSALAAVERFAFARRDRPHPPACPRPLAPLRSPE